MQFGDVVATGLTVASTRARGAKTDAIAARLRTADAGEIAITIGLLRGEPRQGRIGVGWAAAFGAVADHAPNPTLTIGEVDAAITALAATTGAGSAGARDRLLRDLFARATDAEADYLRRLFVGELRHGALDGVVADAVARAFDVPVALVRRAWMFLGDLAETGVVARAGGADALRAVGLQLMRPIQPMLASTAPDVSTAVSGFVMAAVEWKLDGIRIQVHKLDDDVRVFTRNLNDVTARVPEVVEVVRGFDAAQLVLDGEAMIWEDGGTPVAFQDTMSRVGREDDTTWEHSLRPYFFDCLHRNGVDMLDLPLRERAGALHEVVGEHRVPGVVTDDAQVASQVAADALGAGHEGVVVKDVESPYEAGRRGSAWRKVKPVNTFDLVVLAAEWGHGRRTGWLSNLHLGARDPAGGFVMVGKTFKGLTDELLTWQTARLLELEERRDRATVYVRPELVVEIALDGVQASRRYAGGLALRFARVKRYRSDKAPAEADTIQSLQALLPTRATRAAGNAD
ncbi:MAG TPA: ATP-dependent DNA ligase [Acidimicrobiales bacterium]|nr:ATP-dependent DNA ligase [Acidimicrobiales bacterium]